MAADATHVASTRLAGKAALVTGGSRGLGRCVAERFVAEGAHVAICARDEGPLVAAATALQAARPDPSQRVFAHAADVSVAAEVERLVAETVNRLGGIDVLVANAGISGPIGPAEEVDWREWTETIAVNLFGTVLLCRAVVPLMKGQGGGKIIVISGGGATSPRPRFSAYAASKAAVVRFMETLAVELEGSGIDVNAIAPGALNTRMLDDTLAAGPERAGQDAYASALTQRETGGTPLHLPTDLIAFLASAESGGISGRLIAAVWDDWPRLPQLRQQLAGSDVFTLRRITPKDRGWTSQ